MLLLRVLIFWFVCCASLVHATEERSTIAFAFADFPPFAYLDEQGQPVGKGLDFLKELAAEAGYTLQLRGLPSARLIRNIKEGQVQMWASDEHAAFSLEAGLPGQHSFFTFRQCLYAPAGSGPLQLPQALQGKRVILIQGGLYPSPAVQALLTNESLQMKKIYAPNYHAGLGMLQRGRGDYFFAYDYAYVESSSFPLDSQPECTLLASSVMRFFVSRSRADARQVLKDFDAAFVRMARQGRLPAWITPPAADAAPASAPGQ